MQRELSCVWMRCGAACRQGLRMQRSMRMHFLLSTPSLGHGILIYTVGSLQAKCIVKMSSIFLPVLRHKDFFGWVMSLHGEKNVSNFFRLFYNIVCFLKKLWVFLFEIIDFALEENASGQANRYICTFSILRNPHKACSKMSGAHYDIIMLVRNILISSVLVQSVILNQSKVFLAAQGFLSK